MSKMIAGWKSLADAAPAASVRASVKAPSWIRIPHLLIRCANGKRAPPKCNRLPATGSTRPRGRGTPQPVADRLAQALGRDRHDGDPGGTAAVQLAQHREQVARRLGKVAGRAQVQHREGAGGWARAEGEQGV